MADALMLALMLARSRESCCCASRFAPLYDQLTHQNATAMRACLLPGLPAATRTGKRQGTYEIATDHSDDQPPTHF